MAQITLNTKFSEEVNGFRSAAAELGASSYPTIDVGDLSLPTVDAYQDRLRQIWKTMVRFKLLVQKDANDMDDLAAMLKAADGSSN